MEYLHAHLLSTEEILRILRQREIDIPEMDCLSRPEILQIFNKFALPLSQRKSERNTLTALGQGDSQAGEKVLQKRIPPPIENECIAKISRITLTLSVNGTKQKRCARDEAAIINNPPKRQKITWP